MLFSTQACPRPRVGVKPPRRSVRAPLQGDGPVGGWTGRKRPIQVGTQFKGGEQ